MGGSIFLFVESKSFEFSVEEGGSFFLLRIFERFKDSLRSVFLGKEGAFRLLTYFEELISKSRQENFARTFREDNKVFILQMGLNAHGSFLMISELLHGRRKGLIIVPEGKLGSGWRGFGFHLRKAIAPDSLGAKPPALFPSLPKLGTHKSFLSAVVEGDRNYTGGSRTGQLEGNTSVPKFQKSIKSHLPIKSRLSSQQFQNLGLRERGAGQVSVVPEDEVTFVVQDDAGTGAESPLSLEVSFCLVRGLNGKWEIKSSNLKEVGFSAVGPMQEDVRPTPTPAKSSRKPPLGLVAKPKPIKVWQPLRKEQPKRPSPSRKSQGPVSSSRPPLVPRRSAMTSDVDTLCSGKADEAKSDAPELFDSFLASDDAVLELLGSDEASDGSVVAASCSGKAGEAWTGEPERCVSFFASDDAEIVLLGFDEAEEARFGGDCTSSETVDSLLASGVPKTEHHGSVEPAVASFGSVCTSELGENAVCDPRLFLQDHSGNVVKKWGNSEQWVLELRNGRRVAVPVQLALPRCEAFEALENQQQLALVSLESSEEEDVISVEDGTSDSSSEEAGQPLVVDPIAFSLPSDSTERSLAGKESGVGPDSLGSQVPYSDWFLKRFNNFDSFLGTSLVGLEEQATDFLLAVEAELCRRAEVNKNSSGSTGSGVKGLRELKGLFSSINYGSSSPRRSGFNRKRVLSVSQ